MTRYHWLVVIVVLAAGFFAGRASVRVDDRELADSLAVWRDHRRADAAEDDSTRQLLAALRDTARLALEEAARWRASAAARTALADRHRARGDSLALVLAGATTPEDSLRACMAEVTERRGECADLRAANGALLQAAAADSAARAAVQAENAALLLRAGRQDARLSEADGLIRKLERNVRGCRVPLIGIPCPTGLATYSTSRRAFDLGGGIPIRSWLTVGVTVEP